MIRVLQILGQRPTGGVGAFLYNYHQQVDRDNVQFDYLMFDDQLVGEYDEKVKQLGATVHVLPALKHHRLLHLCNLVDDFFLHNASKYQVVHLHSPNMAFMLLKYAKKYGIERRIVHSHSTVYSENKLKCLRNKILCSIGFKYATDYFACSKAAGEFYYGKDTLKNGKVKIINNAIDLDKYKFDESIRNRVRKELGLEDKFVVGHIGRMAPAKNQMFLLEIFKEVKQENDQAVLLMIGDGPLRDAVEAKIKELNLNDSVILLGARKDVPELLMAMDVFLLPSLYEGLPVVGIEAQASGLPCFFSDTITAEVRITDLVNYLLLDDKPSKWATAILKHLKIIRKTSNKDIIDNGFSIKKEAQELQQIYYSFNKV